MFRTASFDINKVCVNHVFLVQSLSQTRTQGYLHLIKFFAAMALASDAELGWDPTIFQILDGNDHIQYCIKVGQHWYQTFGEPLVNFRANNIVGRGTRVWRAFIMKLIKQQLVADTTTEYALKDVYMERTENQEAIKIKHIRHALKQWQRTYPNAPDAANFKQDSTLDQEYTIDPMWFEAPKEDPHAFNNNSSPQFPNHTWGDDPWDKHFPLVKEHGTVRFGPDDKEDSIQTWMKDGGYDKFRVGKFRSYLAPDMVPSTPPKTSMNKHSKQNQSAGNPPLLADPHSSL
jgi:hypothetical protein